MGLGDAIYVQSVVRYLLEQGEKGLRVATAWPDVFAPFGDQVECVPFTRQGIDILAHYSLRKPQTATTQWEDVCITARVPRTTPLRFTWNAPSTPLADQLRQTGKPVILVQLPRAPMGRTDGFGHELLPDCRRIQDAIDALSGRATLVQVGAGRPAFQFRGLDVDLRDTTEVADLLAIAVHAAAGFLGYVSFFVPLAESLERPALFVWSRRGLRSTVPYVRQITPQKVLYRAGTSAAIPDDSTDAQLRDAVDLLLRQTASD